MRPFPWKSRVALPAAVVLSLLAAAGWSAKDTLISATDVRVVPVVLRPMAGAVASAAPGAGQARTTGGASAAAGVTGGPGGGGGVVAQAAGWVEPDPYAVAISALTDGVVREVLVLEGQRVRAGEVVARLVDDDARLAVRRAEAELASRRADAAAARRQWDHPVERERAAAVSAAAVEETRSELAKLDADVAAENARAEEIADQIRRLEGPAATGAASAQELAGLRFRLDAQRAVARAAEARRPVLEALLRQREAEARAAAANAKLRIEETRTLETADAAAALAEAQLAEARLRLERCEVRSPADGVVMSRMTEPGGKLMLGMDSHTSAFVARLYDPARLQVRVDVPLADAPKVGVGTPAEVTAEALPGRTMRGEVTRVVHEADVTKNTLQFKVRIVDPPDGLKPEMLARVRFLASKGPTAASGAAVGSAAGAATRPGSTPAPPAAPPATGGAHLPFVPESLVVRDGDAASVLVADRRAGVAVRRAVTLGADRAGDWVAVTAGLSAGEDLIAAPAGVRPGDRIRVVGEADEGSGGVAGKAGQ